MPVPCTACGGGSSDDVAVREWGDPGETGILMWPGLGATGGYFAGVAEAMPGRVVSVDPPGFGDSAPLDSYSYDAARRSWRAR